MSRAIDADALEKEGWSLHRTIRVDKNTSEYQTKPLRQVPTIEPRCEACEAFNKTRLLIPQPERTGRWIDSHTTCSECGWQMIDDVIESPNIVAFNFCPNCGADMRTPVETARDIVHEAIDNSVWADSVDTAKMHKVVDDKYAEIRGDANVDANT